MNLSDDNTDHNTEDNTEIARECLTLINRIAARAAASPDVEHVADTLMELYYALKQSQQHAIEGANPGRRNLMRTHEELDFIDSTSQGLTAREVLKYAIRSTWN